MIGDGSGRMPPPEGRLRASVTVPARNEEERILACLEALAAQRGIAPGCCEVLLVVDDCTDGTESIARRFARETPGFELHFLKGSGTGVGNARKLGLDAAAERLLSIGRPDGLVASTDADSVVAPDWLKAQLDLIEGGAQAIGGRISLERDGLDLPPHVMERYEAHAARRYARITARYRADSDGVAAPQEHWQFSGASLSMRADVYRRIGGLAKMRCLEDEYLERVLEEAGVGIVRSSAVRVTTSSRLEGRAEFGLASDLTRFDRDAGFVP